MDELNYMVCDDNFVVNTKWIRWIKKKANCFYICTKTQGCTKDNTITVCNKESPDSYKKIQQLFKL